MTQHRTDPWTRLAHLWPLLAETRIPGTRRPWRAPELTSAQRAERDALIRDERRADTAEYPLGLRWLARASVIFAGVSPAPLHLDVTDTLTVLWRQLATAAADLATPENPLPPRVAPWSPLSDPRPLLEWCSQRAEAALDGFAVDRAAWDMLHIVESALGEIWDGQKLTAICPWCHGGLSRDPSWRVRRMPGGMVVIVCESGTCEPPEADCGDHWRGNPVWHLWEWEWLAIRLWASDRQAAAS